MIFRPYHEAGFTTEIIANIPPDGEISAGSQVKDRHRGKTPGVRNSDGTWSGRGGRWADELFATVADLKKWQLWHANVGLQGRNFPGLDIDVENETWAAKIQTLAEDMLGFAPVRRRQGSPRRLLVYRRPKDHDIIRKKRLAWIDPLGVKHAVELLAHGQQYVIEGQHPKGGRYEWEDGNSLCDAGPDGLAEISADMISAFFVELAS